MGPIFWVSLLVIWIAFTTLAYFSARWTANPADDDSESSFTIPVANSCPQCGGTDSRTITGEKESAWVNTERICDRCKVMYTVPVPAKVGVVFLVLGGGLALSSVALTRYVSERFPEYPAVAWPVLLVGFGGGFWLAFALGFRTIQFAQKANDCKRSKSDPSG